MANSDEPYNQIHIKDFFGSSFTQNQDFLEKLKSQVTKEVQDDCDSYAKRISDMELDVKSLKTDNEDTDK